MLQEWKAMEKPEEEEIRARLAAAKEKLAKQQLLIKEQKIPVLVDRKSTRLNSSHANESRMPSSA